MDRPLAYFLTWTTYGTWLPGDLRGWYARGTLGVRDPDFELNELTLVRLAEEPVILTPEQRLIVDDVIVRHCRIRSWKLYARNVRSNHVHAIVAADIDGEAIREQLKAWGSRHLSQQAGLRGAGKNGRRKWWTEKGDIEEIWDPDHLHRAIEYVVELQ